MLSCSLQRPLKASCAQSGAKSQNAKTLLEDNSAWTCSTCNWPGCLCFNLQYIIIYIQYIMYVIGWFLLLPLDQIYKACIWGSTGGWVSDRCKGPLRIIKCGSGVCCGICRGGPSGWSSLWPVDTQGVYRSQYGIDWHIVMPTWSQNL